MASRAQVRALLDDGLDYAEAARRLGISPGQAYLIATGMANPPHDNPTSSQPVRDWIAGRVAADRPIRRRRRGVRPNRTLPRPKTQTTRRPRSSAAT